MAALTAFALPTSVSMRTYPRTAIRASLTSQRGGSSFALAGRPVKNWRVAEPSRSFGAQPAQAQPVLRTGPLELAAERLVDAVGGLLGLESGDFVAQDQQVVLIALAVLHLVAEQRFGAEAEALEGGDRALLVE